MKKTVPKKHTRIFLLFGFLILFGIIFSATLVVSRLLGNDDIVERVPRSPPPVAATPPAQPLPAGGEAATLPPGQPVAPHDPERHAADQAAQLRAVFYEQRALGDIDTLTLDEDAIRELQDSGALIH